MNRTGLLRTFIAVKVHPEFQLVNTLSELKKEMSSEPVKWVELNNFHLTLKFLGDTSREQADDVTRELDEICRQFPSFSCQLQGLGYFKSEGTPRVLFANIEGAEMLDKISSELGVRLLESGFKPDTSRLSPHLTLARIKFLRNKKVFYEAVEKYRNISFQSLAVRELIFYQSVLNPSGPVYKPLAVKELVGNTGRPPDE